jgi:DMSO/TMAO reductase YedYZ molybdopterin-dependent catalytic subunit
MRGLTRREFIALGTGGLVVLAGGALAYPLLQTSLRPQPIKPATTVEQPHNIGGTFPFTATSLPLPLWITPNENLYTVQYDQLPSVSLTSYSLWVYGLVRTELHLSYNELRALPTEMRMHTLECIGNAAGGNLIGNVEWRGVSLRALLERAGVDGRAKYVTIGGIDEYLTSVPIERAMHDQALLAYEMNGKPLPLDHGYPLRAILPGVYGQKQPKWVTGINVTEQEELGPWEKKGWSQQATIQLNSGIKFPREGQPVPRGDILLAGVAYSGEIGVRAVEVSSDGGKTWNDTLLTRGPSLYVWTQWGYWLRNPAPGEYRLMVRATDNRGNRQGQTASGILSSVFPNGTSEIHSMMIQVHEQ